jgi:acyl dehydratase
MGYVTDYHQSLIGVVGPVRTAPAPVSADSIRRFVQAAMIDDPVHWDEEAAVAAGYPAIVAPPLYPLNALRRGNGEPDPLDALADNPDWDGAGESTPQGLPPLKLPLHRMLNGGVSAEFFRLARIGDVISSQARYAEIADRAGRSGDFVTVTIETQYRNQRDELLARTRSTIILR